MAFSSCMTLTVTNQDYLEKYYKFVKRMAMMKSDAGLQGFIKKKVWDLAHEITSERLSAGTTMDEYMTLYAQSHKIVDSDSGFILYNDASIPADTNHPETYPDGMFSIALAFEYGVGIQGLGSYIDDYFTPWVYNHPSSNVTKSGYWYLPSSEIPNAQYDVNGRAITFGYDGFEIYRHIAIEIEKRINFWIFDYFEKGFEV